MNKNVQTVEKQQLIKITKHNKITQTLTRIKKKII